MTPVPAGAAGATRWFVTAEPRPSAPVVLFCLPHAGGGPSVYHGWAAACGPGIDLAVLALPGREARFAEPPEVDPRAVAAAVAARAGGRPYALFGHSMGGRLALELARELHRRGDPQPVRLYLAGCRPPQLGAPLGGLWRAGDGELVARLARLGGMPAEVLAEPELRDLVLPAIRCDLRWLDSLPARPPPVPVPLRVFAGADDPTVTPYEALGWLEHTRADFELRTEPGGHFFHRARPGTGAPGLIPTIRADLSSAVGGRPEPVSPPGPDEVHIWSARAGTPRAGGDRACAGLLDRVRARYRGLDGPGAAAVRTSVARAAGRVLVALSRGAAAGIAVAPPGEPAGHDRTTRLPLPGETVSIARPPGTWRLRFTEVCR